LNVQANRPVPPIADVDEGTHIGGLDRVVEVDPVDVAATAERRSGVQSD